MIFSKSKPELFVIPTDLLVRKSFAFGLYALQNHNAKRVKVAALFIALINDVDGDESIECGRTFASHYLIIVDTM